MTIMPSLSLRRSVAAMMAAALLLSSALADAQGRAPPEGFADLVERVSPAVVNISTTQNIQSGGGRTLQDIIPNLPPGSPFEDLFRDFFDQQQRRGGDGQNRTRRVTSLGSGFIIDASGVVVTNNHVISEADEIKVILQDGSELPAKVVGRDQRTDLAVLRIEPKSRLVAVNWADSDRARVGDWVLAIGNPLGFGGTVTAGIVSARGRNIGSGPYDDFIQTDAPINKGNSGGPLFNTTGEVIGVNTAIISPTGASIGIGFSVPSNMARMVVRQILEFGKARRGWLGVVIQPVTPEMTQALGLDRARGALVADVTVNGPARGRIEPGDVIITFDGKPVPNSEALPRMVAETAIGKQVPVEVMRKGRSQSLTITLGELPDAEQAQPASSRQQQEGSPRVRDQVIEALGINVAALTPDLRRRFEIKENVTGVVVTQVNPNGPAAARRIRPGDVIEEVGQTAVRTPDAVQARIKQLTEARQGTALLLINRAGDKRFEPVALGGR